MMDKTLTILVVAVIALSAAHDADHLLRDDFSQPSAWTIAGIFLSIKYSLTGAALYYYFRGRIGAIFWAVVGVLGAALLWFAHLIPSSDQRPDFILAKYDNSLLGHAAVGVVYALMLALLAMTIYAGWLAGRRLAGR